MHARRQIRDAVVALLTGLTTTGSRCHTGRTRPLAKDHAPTLLVYTFEETSDDDVMSRPAKIARSLMLAVEGRVTASDPPDDTLDAIAEEVETALGVNPTFGLAGVKNTRLTATRITTESPGERHVGEIRLEFTVEYRTRADAPGTFA